MIHTGRRSERGSFRAVAHTCPLRGQGGGFTPESPLGRLGADGAGLQSRRLLRGAHVHVLIGDDALYLLEKGVNRHRAGDVTGVTRAKAEAGGRLLVDHLASL